MQNNVNKANNINKAKKQINIIVLKRYKDCFI